MIHGLIIALFVSFLVSFTAMAQDTKLLEAAKKETGAVIAYGSLESNTVEPIIDAFRQRTGLTVEYWRASATKVMDRALAELRAGKSVFDVMVNNSGAIHVMKKEGLFAKYLSPAAKAFPKEVIDPEVGPIYRNTPVGIVYNKGFVSAADAPRSLEDLLNPKYKGQICDAGSNAAHDHAAMVGELVQNHGQGKGPAFYSRSRREQTVHGGIFRARRGARIHWRNADRDKLDPLYCHVR